MPTLVEEYTVDETARASDIAWVEREFEQENSANDTTLSGSLLVAALKDFRRSQKTASPSEFFSLPPPSQPCTEVKHAQDLSVSLLGSPDLVRTPHTPVPKPASRAALTHSPLEFTPGPNQQVYEAKYKVFVAKIIEKCRVQHPEHVPNYKELSPNQQQKEQQRVLRLLERLQLGGNDGNDTEKLHNPTNNSSSQRCTNSTKKKSVSFALNRDDSQTVFSPQWAEPMDTSVGLLSPIPPQQSPQTSQTSFDNDVSPVELPRGAAPGFSSPPPKALPDDSYRKRMATSSGKRGADAARQKRQSEVLATMELHSPVPKIFTASQSPIYSSDESKVDMKQRRCRRGLDDDSSSVTSAGTQISFGHIGPHSDYEDEDSLDSIEETMVDRRLPLGTHVPNRLQPGKAVHFQPLNTKRQRPKSRILTQTVPDPLEKYSGKARDRMNAVYMWIERRLQSKSLPGAVVFDMTENKNMDITLKLSSTVPTRRSVSSSSTLRGQTLVVLRERSSLEAWKRVFREGSTLGLLCHCELPVKERKSVSTAQKCSNYGLVLTTFDALASPDLTMMVGEAEGVATVEQSQESSGWLQARASNSQGKDHAKCKRLSVLHRITWAQVIFVDELGRKSFLAKPETSRNSAAAVLPAEKRLLFFSNNSSTPAGFTDLLNSDKRALSGVATVLHTDWENIGDGDCTGKGVTLDFSQVDRIR